MHYELLILLTHARFTGIEMWKGYMNGKYE